MNAYQLSKATGAKLSKASLWLPWILAAMAEFEINTPERQAMFLAQIGHESGGLHWVVELWGPTPAQRRYEGRLDLGNSQPGDGFRFRGRGFIQITGRYNYEKAEAALGVDLITNPAALARTNLAARAAAWWWQAHGLNEIADRRDVLLATQRINGGRNGLEDRRRLYSEATKALA